MRATGDGDSWPLLVPAVAVLVVAQAARKLAAIASGGSPLGVWRDVLIWLGALALTSWLVAPLRRWWYAEIADRPPPVTRTSRVVGLLAWVAALFAWLIVLWVSEKTRMLR